MKLKKLFAGILAVAMMATMAAPAFATEVSAASEVTPSTSNASTELKNNFGDGLELNKNYTVAKGTSPEETFNFEMTYVSSKYRAKGVDEPVIGTKKYEAHFTAKTAGDYDQTFMIPKADLDIDGVGEYVYKIVEKEGTSASVKYDNSELYMIVAVTHATDEKGNITDADNLVYTVTLRRGNATTGTKVAPADAFTNVYAKDGDTVNVWDLSLTKTVQGDFADINRYYKFTITLNGVTGKTYHGAIVDTAGTSNDNPAVGTVIAIDGTATTVYLKRNETFKLTNIPDGVTYTIIEDKTDLEGYTVTGEVTTATELKGANVDATVNNKHEGTPDTGVILDNAPYIALMMVVVAGAAVMIIKKRRHFED